MAAALKEKAPLRLRHELKYTISPGEDQLLTSRLRALLPHDPHADAHGIYRVRSLYFDTPGDMALRQKVNGVDRREKFRLRYYQEDLDVLRLEKKIKVHGLCGKLSARLSLEEARMLLSGDIGFLLHREEPVLAELYSKMKAQLLAPRTVVTYYREAFLYGPGNVRVTIDRGLLTGAPADFLSSSRRELPVHEGLSVLEVKYDQFLPDLIRLAVRTPGTDLTAFSKYAVCRKYD